MNKGLYRLVGGTAQVPTPKHSQFHLNLRYKILSWDKCCHLSLCLRPMEPYLGQSSKFSKEWPSSLITTCSDCAKMSNLCIRSAAIKWFSLNSNSFEFSTTCVTVANRPGMKKGSGCNVRAWQMHLHTHTHPHTHPYTHTHSHTLTHISAHTRTRTRSQSGRACLMHSMQLL